MLGTLADLAGHDIFLNVSEPFCLVTLGVQVRGSAFNAVPLIAQADTIQTRAGLRQEPHCRCGA
eukprot:SAG31_NODE_1738_length_7402_cov_14.270163_2_plen_64_part_00